MNRPCVAIVAPGEMGCAIARQLGPQGVRLLTSLQGRSAASTERARAAGFVAVDSDEALVAQADLLLSVVPPDQAEAVARRFAPVLSQAARRPVYVDCNAIAPDAARAIGGIVAATGTRFVDACLFGGPTSGKPGVVLYACGPDAASLAPLGELGIRVQLLQGETGAASTLKLAFAGIHKGFTALGAAMLLAAVRAGAAGGLADQLADAQPELLAYISRFVPAMFPKAGRWAPEMREIAGFLADDPVSAAVYEALAPLYAQIAEGVKQHDPDLEAVAAFCREQRTKGQA